jgi:CheY-like chemotaxis protein
MSRVVVAVAGFWQPRLADSVLWRNGLEWVNAEDASSVFDIARAARPRLVLLDGSDPNAREAMRRLREDELTRETSIVVLLRASASPHVVDELRQAGANIVLSEEDEPRAWDDRFEKLLGTPPRREVRVPVSLTLWSRDGDGAGAKVVGESINLSVSGVLIETSEPLERGTRLDLSFRLPTAAEELRLVGKVIWTAAGPDGRSRSGVAFQRFHGAAMQAILGLFYTHRPK